MDLLKPLVALLAIVNPIGAVPFFLAFTLDFSRPQRRRTIAVASFSAFMVIAVSALAGLKIIEFFGISIASFQVGGGTLLLISAIQMLNAQPADFEAAGIAPATLDPCPRNVSCCSTGTGSSTAATSRSSTSR